MAFVGNVAVATTVPVERFADPVLQVLRRQVALLQRTSHARSSRDRITRRFTRREMVYGCINVSLFVS
jgi:hypothetical protein